VGRATSFFGREANACTHTQTRIHTGTLRDGAQDIKILMDALNKLMPELEEEAHYICADRARLAAWANSEKSKNRSVATPLESDEQVQLLRKEVSQLKTDKEEYSSKIREEVMEEVKKDKDALEQALRQELSQAKEDKDSLEREMEQDKVAMEEEKGQLLAAVTQLQHTVESYEKKLESEAAAQNAQILSLVAKLEREETAHLATSQELEDHKTEIDRFESVLQSCMDALAEGRQEKTKLQNSLDEHQASLLALVSKCAAYEQQLQAHAIHVQEESPMEMTVKLDLDFSEAGAEGSPKRAQFEAALTYDLSSAGGIAKDRVLINGILDIAPAGINATVGILPDAAGQGGVPSAVVALLLLQMQDPASALRKGALTSLCSGISVLTPAQTAISQRPNVVAGTAVGHEGSGAGDAMTVLERTNALRMTFDNESTMKRAASKAGVIDQLQPLLQPRLHLDGLTLDEAEPLLAKMDINFLRTALTTGNVQPVLTKLKAAAYQRPEMRKLRSSPGSSSVGENQLQNLLQAGEEADARMQHSPMLKETVDGKYQSIGCVALNLCRGTHVLMPVFDVVR
jgi:predicted  nucleic acid-binding Zn-ribbon protein